MKKIVLIRHGESIWNQKNIFTGWTDVKLSKKGIKEAKNAGILLKKNNFTFNYAYTSFLKRAIHTLWKILYELDLMWITTKKTWKLNERHYGNLQGLNKDKISKKYGKKKVLKWRRSYTTKPPQINLKNKKFPGNEIKYKKLKKQEIPLGESLLDTYNRVIPYWKNKILPKINQNLSIIIVAHGNSLRALVKYLDKISDKDIIELNIPTGIPLIYEFKDNLEVKNKFYLK